MSGNRKTSLLLWPLAALWRLLALVFELTGRLLALVLGGVLLIVGAILSLTGILAVIGIPMILFGLVLLIRGLF